MRMRTQLLVFGTACLSCFCAWGQTEPATGKLNARDLFYAAREESAKAKPAAHKTAVKAQPKPAPVPVAKGSSTPPERRTSTPPEGRPSAPPEGRSDIIRAAYSGVPLGLRYTVLKRSGDRSIEVSPGMVFHSGDKIQLAVEVSDSGYLYIVTQGSSGTWEVLFPSAKIEHGDNRVESRRRYVVPQGYVFSFVGQPGVEKLFVIFSRQPESEIDRLIYSLGGGGKGAPAAEPARPPASSAPTMLASAAPIGNELIGQFRQLYSRDLIIEKAEDEPTSEKPEDKGVYVVNPKGASDSRVVADIHLTHQ
jgi:hypothetical protein